MPRTELHPKLSPTPRLFVSIQIEHEQKTIHAQAKICDQDVSLSENLGLCCVAGHGLVSRLLFLSVLLSSLIRYSEVPHSSVASSQSLSGEQRVLLRSFNWHREQSTSQRHPARGLLDNCPDCEISFILISQSNARRKTQGIQIVRSARKRSYEFRAFAIPRNVCSINM